MGGDFNHELRSLPIWKSLEEHGWKESRTFAYCDPSSLPPTYCKRDSQGSILASSSKDFILLCPKMCRLQPQMTIWESSGLPDHNPIVLNLDIPVKSGVTRQWKLPRSLTSDQISVLQASINNPISQDVQTIRITMWSSTVEQVWESLLKSANKSTKLKPNQKGRGAP